jgi:hypothetical protein
LPLFGASCFIFAFGRKLFVTLNLVNELAISKKYELEEEEGTDLEEDEEKTPSR